MYYSLRSLNGSPAPDNELTTILACFSEFMTNLSRTRVMTIYYVHSVILLCMYTANQLTIMQGNFKVQGFS